MMEPTDWDSRIQANTQLRAEVDPYSIQIEVEARLARIETKQDALYAEIHAVRLTVERIDENFQKLVEGVMGAMTSNPLLSRLLGGGRKNAV